ncbi:MAG TPA: protease modulator HflC [Candidatus Hydrogenedentes bacterium]|nr:protease modulator HflC [Candidatus Hydrogenedentota bacterium]
MNPAKLIAAVVPVVIVLIGLLSSMYIIDEREQAVITRLSRPVRVIVGDVADDRYESIKGAVQETARNLAKGAEVEVARGAGLYFKRPFIDTVNRFPDTLLFYDAEPEDVILADKKKLIVDNFARWRIEDPLLFWISVQDELRARGRLDDIIYSTVREELGRNDLIEVIRTSNRMIEAPLAPAEDAVVEEIVVSAVEASDDPSRQIIQRGRERIMDTVSRRADEQARKQFGIRIVDVRIKRAELLPDNLQAVFERMTAERSRISKAYRSDGGKQSEIIKSETDKRVQVLLAEARRDAEMVRGQGEAEALGIIAESFGSNAELYRFIRTLEVMEKDTPDGSEFIIGIDSSIYRAIRGPEGP